MSAAAITAGTPSAVPLTSTVTNGSLRVELRQVPLTPGGLVCNASLAGAECGSTMQTTMATVNVAAGAAAGDVLSFKHNVGGTSGGGIQAGTLQLFGYKNGGFEAEYMRYDAPGSVQEGVTSGTWGYLDGLRVGYVTLVSGPNVVVCPSTKAFSTVRLRLAGTTAAAGFPALPIPVPAIAVVVPAASFTVTGLPVHVGMIYDYEVVG